MTIRTGPAGADGIGYLPALQKAAKLGLGCLEVTFTYGEILDRLPRRFHAHFSGIEYGPKGDRRHLETTPAFFRPLAGRRLGATLVCESPRPYPDAAMMRRVLDGLRARLPAPKGPLVKRSVRTST